MNIFYDTLFQKERIVMKFARIFGFLCMMIPVASFGATDSEFQNASKLLSAARRGDIQTVQILINNGANINYVDSTGLSLVCTAIMNNDNRAVQILEMYGADASKCDRQIKQHKQKAKKAVSGEEYGFFSGLSSTHVVVLSAIGAAAVVGGVVLLADVFDKKNKNNNSSGGSRGNGGGGGGEVVSLTQLFALNLPYGPACSDGSCPTDFSFWENQNDFTYMSDNTTQNVFNYLMVAHAYNAFVRGYLGMDTIRIASDLSPFNLKTLPYTSVPGGGKPFNVAMITESGVNATGSAVDDVITWVDKTQITTIQSACAGDTSSDECQAALANAAKTSRKYFNNGDGVVASEDTSFNLTGSGSVFGNATDSDTKLAKIIAGWNAGEREEADFDGFIPNGQLTVYKIGTGESGVSDYKNFYAIDNALRLQSNGAYVSNVVANLSMPSVAGNLDYSTVDTAKIRNDLAETQALKESVFGDLIDNFYNLNTNDDTGEGAVNKPSMDAADAYKFLGNYQKQIWVNPAGYNVGTVQSLEARNATFENFAPVVYNNLENLFMTVVAVKPANGTAGETVAGYSAQNSGKLELSTWVNPDNENEFYTSRMCGLTGTGNDGQLNPWCFAAPGTTGLEATAAMAGAVSLVQSAFDYMTPNQVFLLLALTADGPYLGTNPDTDLAWSSMDDLRAYLKNMYSLPGNLPSSDSQYFESFKQAFGYGMINLERATRPGTNVYFYTSDTNHIVSASGNAFWRKAISTSTNVRSSSALSLTDRAAINISFFDVIQSADGSVSLPRVWNTTFTQNNVSKQGLYMGDVLADFNVDSKNKRSSQFGNIVVDMAMSSRAYNDNLNGLDNLRVAFVSDNYNFDAQYQHYMTDGESRFSGRGNGVLSLLSNGISSNANYKYGNFSFGGRAYSGTISDENLLDTDPAISSQTEPAVLGLANGGALFTGYNNDKLNIGVSFGNMNETKTVLGMLSEGLLELNGANTQYVDTVVAYKPIDKLKLSMRATFANTRANVGNGIISEISDLKSNAFALGVDYAGFDFTAAMPLAVVDGKMGYDYAELSVVENGNNFDVVANNAHVEYIDLATQKRELRFSGAYKHPLGDFTDAGVGFIYRVNPGNTDAFGNESILMFKIHHGLGI